MSIQPFLCYMYQLVECARMTGGLHGPEYGIIATLDTVVRVQRLCKKDWSSGGQL